MAHVLPIILIAFSALAFQVTVAFIRADFESSAQKLAEILSKPIPPNGVKPRVKRQCCCGGGGGGFGGFPLIITVPAPAGRDAPPTGEQIDEEYYEDDIPAADSGTAAKSNSESVPEADDAPCNTTGRAPRYLGQTCTHRCDCGRNANCSLCSLTYCCTCPPGTIRKDGPHCVIKHTWKNPSEPKTDPPVTTKRNPNTEKPTPPPVIRQSPIGYYQWFGKK